MKITSSMNFFCQGDILSNISRSYHVSNLGNLSYFEMPKKMVCKVWSKFKMTYLSISQSLRGVWFWLENVPKETLSTEPLLKLQKNFDVHPLPCIPKRLKVPSYIWRKQCKCLFTCNWKLLTAKTENKYN